MKRLRLILAGGSLAVLLTVLPAPRGAAPSLQNIAIQPPSTRVGPNPAGSDLVIAEAAPDEGSYQAPVIEGEELPDAPAADAAAADKEAQMPAVEQPPSGGEVPGAEQPPEVPQPGATP